MAAARLLPDAQAAAAALRRLTMAETRALAAVKAAGTLSGAAERLGVSQPTLSQHVRVVEDKLGVKLFTRHRRGMEPTPAGSVLLRLAGALQLDLAWAAEELAVAVREDLMPLRIGSMAVTSGGLLAAAFGRLAADPQGAPAVLVEGPREALLEHLRHGRIDLFVGRLPADEPPADLRQEVLFLDTIVVVTAARHALARLARVDMKTLEHCEWVMPAEDTAFHQQIEASFHRAGLPLPRARVMSYSMVAIPAIVSVSSMIGFLPTSLFAAGGLSASLHRLDVPIEWVPWPIGILMRPDDARQERLQPLLRTLRAVAASARAAVAMERQQPPPPPSSPKRSGTRKGA